MTTTQNFFLTCLRDHLHKKNTEIPADVDWDALLRMAMAHDLAGIIYHQIKKKAAEAEVFSLNYAATIYYYAGRNDCFRKLTQELNDNSIPFVPVKGQVIAPLYPFPALRTMGDIDLLVREEDLPKIHEIMLQSGYESLSGDASIDRAYKNKLIEFELHPVLICSNEEVEKQEYQDYFNNFWPYVEADGQLKKEFHLLYLLVHLRKHLLNHGAGFRQFMDIAVFTQAYRAELDWDWFQKQLKALNLCRFSEVCYAYIDRWFSIPSPIPTQPLDEDMFARSTQIIFENGVFGFQNEDHTTSLLSYQLAKRGRVAGRVGYMLQRYFPPYRVLIVSDHYAFLKGKPYLLPFVWVYRWFYVLLYKKAEGTEKIKKMSTSNDGIQNKVHMLHEWGLDS